jgi:hypothetical protein
VQRWTGQADRRVDRFLVPWGSAAARVGVEYAWLGPATGRGKSQGTVCSVFLSPEAARVSFLENREGGKKRANGTVDSWNSGDRKRGAALHTSARVRARINNARSGSPRGPLLDRPTSGSFFYY